MTLTKKRVLIFTYYWPPAGGPGVQRFLKFSKYLTEFGWEPIIITPANGSYPYYDDSLEKDIPEGLQIHKTKTFDWFRLYNMMQGKKGKSVPVAMIGIKESNSFFQRISKYIRANCFIPDGRTGWNKYAYRKGVETIQSDKIDAIITTGPPHSTHLVGSALKRKYQIPWLADFRDPWTNIYYNRFLPRTKRSIKKDQALEDNVLNHSDCVTVISEGLKQEFKDRCKKIEVIYNGFDDEDIKERDLQSTDKFILSYIGNLKPNQNIPDLWDAIKELTDAFANFRDFFLLQLTGKVDPAIIDNLNNLGLSNSLLTQDFVPHHKAIAIMQESSMLLFVIPKAENNELILTGKIFEYLAVKKPMLSIGPSTGNAATVLNEAGRSKMVEYTDKKIIKKNLMECFNNWLSNNKYPTIIEDNSYLKFSRKALTKQLSQTLNAII